MKTFAITTLGCKVNAFESESYTESLKTLGYKEVDFKDTADIYIINTCSVTNTAASKSRQKIHQAIKQNEKAMICVIGCYVQTNQQDLHEIERIDLLIGAKGKDKLAQYIEQGNAMPSISNQRDLQFELLPLKSYTHQTRAFLKIQDGCDQFCSYCIIPYARGNERSAQTDELVDMARSLVAAGHKEIVLSGIHIGRYGKGSDTDLANLMHRLDQQVEGLIRIRLSSIEITEITDEIVALIKSSDKIARHLHIPLQSGCDTVLQRMNRPYTTADYLRRIQKIRQQVPDISISSDIIVGFPGESDEEYEQTSAFAEQCRFSFLHVFPYSVRLNTPAAEMKDQIDAQTKKARAARLIDKSAKLKARYDMQFVNKTVNVLFESYHNGFAIGHTSQYVMVRVESAVPLNNQLHDVLITHHKAGSNYGILDPKAVNP